MKKICAFQRTLSFTIATSLITGCLFPADFERPLDRGDGIVETSDVAADVPDTSEPNDQTSDLTQTCEEGTVDWDEDLANGCERSIIYVSAESTVQPADGSASAPYPTIQEAVDVATEAHVVWVGRGVYEESVTIAADGVVLLGEEAAIESDTPPALLITGHEVHVRDMTISSTASNAVEVTGLPNLKIGVVLERVQVLGGTLKLLDTERAELIEVSIMDVEGKNAPNAGVGAPVTRGLVVENSSDCRVFGMHVRNILGGAGAPTSESRQIAGTGGAVHGILLESTTDCLFEDNTVELLRGGRGGRGVDPNAGGAIGGQGGSAQAVTLRDSTQNVFERTTILRIERGEPAVGSDIPGRVGAAVGFFMSSETSRDNEISASNTVDGSPVLYLHGAEHDDEVIEEHTVDTDVRPTNFGGITVIDASNVIILNNSVSGLIAEGGDSADIASGAAGSQGRPVRGIHLLGCRDCRVEGNTVARLTSGHGGHDNDNSNNSNSGGSAFGIDVVDSDGAIILGNSVTDLISGDGGVDFALASGQANGGRTLSINIENSDGVFVAHNSIDNATSGQGGVRRGANYGIFLDEASVPELQNNAIGNLDEGDLSACVLVKNAVRPRIEFLTCYNSYRAIQVSQGQTTKVTARYIVASENEDACFRNFSSAPNPNDPTNLDVNHAVCHNSASISVNAMLGGNIILDDPQHELSQPGLFLRPESPAIDAGGDHDDACLEPAPNGCKVNLGAHGASERATSRTGESKHCDCLP